jgi:NAD(P)-dependent dehydrogenase (short-subunit alcohol dehydrogenase family)
VSHNKLLDCVVVVNGGDSGIGRTAAVAFAQEGADVVIAYLNEDRTARQTQKLIEKQGRQCLVIKGNLDQEAFCQQVIAATMQHFGRLDIVVNSDYRFYSSLGAVVPNP